MADKKIIKITFDQSDSGKISLKNICLNVDQNFDKTDVNLKIELLPDVKVGLIDDLVNFNDLIGFVKINHEIDFVLNEGSFLEYRMILKPDSGLETELGSTDCAFDKALKFNFVGERSQAKVRIKNMCCGGQRIKFSTEQNHLKSQTSSCLCIKAVLADNSALKCQNKIFVAEKLNNVFAGQINKNLLLGSNVDIFTQPQLEVLSDNVKCKHGAALKTPDDEQLFYLNLRGLSFEKSKNLLIDGFLN